MTVADIDVGTPATPVGNGALSAVGAGDLSAPNCPLAAASCGFTYTPTAAGSSTISALYQPGVFAFAPSSGDTTVTTADPPSPPPATPSTPAEPTCPSLKRKLDRLKAKLARQLAGAGDSRKSARKRAKIRKNIADTKTRKRKRRC